MLINKEEFVQWNKSIGDLITHLSSSSLPGRLMKEISSIIPFERTMILGYFPKGRPLDLYNIGDAEYRNIVQNYISGRYLLDPFYHAYQAGFDDRFYGLVEVAPDDFENSEYNITHYSRTGILDEAVTFVELENSLTVSISLLRGYHEEKFSEQDMEILNSMVPVITSVIRHHWIGDEHPEHDANAQPHVSLQEHIQNAFHEFGRSQLTNRESEVISLILRGYSSNAISEHLHISVGTVKIHRKNSYQKLHISSQTELFSMFLDSLSNPDLLQEELGS